MKLILTQRERLASLGQFLVDEFDNIIARIRGSWRVEHTDDGAHGNVHAKSMATGRVAFSDIVAVLIAEAQVNNYNPEGFATAAMLRISASVDTSITGLLVPQDDAGTVIDGRLIVLENTGQKVVALEHEHSASSPRNRFSLPFGPSSSDVSARLLLPPGGLAIASYNRTLARWRVLSTANDQITTYINLSSSQDDYAPAGFAAARVVRLVPQSADLTISGFDATGVLAPSRKTLINEGIYALAILHANTASDEANRVLCPGQVRYMLYPREAAELYREQDGTWVLSAVSKATRWVDVAYDSAHFTTDTGTWTVQEGDQIDFSYQLDGDKMTVSFDLRTTSVASSPTELRIAVPRGRTIARSNSNPIIAANAGTQINSAYVQAEAGLTYLKVFRDLSATAWGAATNTTRVQGQITFMVREDAGTVSEPHTDVAHGDDAHADADHSDVAHADVEHTDTHSDVPHSDAAHTDTAHQDVAHTDSHTDTHGDTPHVDSAHGDTAHQDTAHSDGHGDVHADHNDGPGHADTHTDTHADTAHKDVAHSDSSHGDSHTDTHSDVAHGDVSHKDTAHGDTGHADVAHTDAHTDTAPHQDVAHVDGGHSDTPHTDSPHSDVGFHFDEEHVDL